MWRGFLLLTLTLAFALAAPDFRGVEISSVSTLCEMNPNTCNCFEYRPSGGCEYNLHDCTCRMIYTARNADADADAKPAPPATRNITSSARLSASTCHVDFSTCLCGFEPVTVPQTDVVEEVAACFTHSSTCQCAWDRGIGAMPLFLPLKPIIYTSETCVTDYSTCTCLVGTIVTPPETSTTLAEKLSSIQSQLLVMQTLLLSMIPPTERLVLEPLGALKTLSVDQRTKAIAEAVVVMTQLKGMVENADAIGRLERVESEALLARISGDVEYLTALSRDPNLLASQIGEIEQPIVIRLRELVAAFEEAMKKVKRNGGLQTNSSSGSN